MDVGAEISTAGEPAGESVDLGGKSEAAPPSVQLTTLQPIAVRDVWPTEPHHFTPWLLANSEQLSKVLGLDVELEDREVQVGQFSLDLIGKELSTGSTVIIENQYGATDHGHLGQILTYAGGTRPTTIVWIAEQFREEHRAALEWLNAHTEPGIRFFGVRLSAVTLAGAPPGLVAPFLELVVQPNDWEKQASAIAAAGTASTTATQELYRNFWSTLEPQLKARGWTNASAPAANWWNLPAGTTGASYVLSFAKFGCRSEIYFDHPDPSVNFARWTTLNDRAEEISTSFGEGLIFDDLPGHKGCRIETRLLGLKITQQDQWPSIASWMRDTQQRLRTAIAAVGGIPSIGFTSISSATTPNAPN
jgi:hypothetical protein